ncbi:hypothetical protein COCNU_scaffold000878G000010 [Cocos nucifera]|nr:hypothetical protein [Cocos nucifera]
MEEEVDTKRERAIDNFKSSKVMEDIKIAFAREAILKGFQICMRRVMENFSDIDLDLLMDESDDEASPSYASIEVGAASHIAEPTLKIFDSTTAAPKPAQELEVVENTPTSFTTAPPKV